MAGNLDPPPAQERRDLAEFSIMTVAGLGLTVTVLFFSLSVLGKLPGSRDFISFWATGQQLVQHANPYDRNAISTLEHAQGLDVRAVLIMRNPPWALPLVYPLGFLSLRVAAILWSLLLIACLLLSVRIARQLYGSPSNHIHWLALAFTPALICLTMGQTALFALLGLVLFLRWHQHRPWLAGTALWLCALKPHLFLPFAAALVAWVLVSPLFTRAWQVAAGAVASLALSSAVASLIDPHAWLDYTRLMRSPAVENEFIPCLSSAIRQWIDQCFGGRTTWLQYLPAALCCLWALVYFWRRRATWDWKTHGSLLMLVSLVAAPYCWFYDQCLAIPALLEGAYATRSRNLIAVLALAILVMDIQICVVQVISPLYLWPAPAWLVWYLFARRMPTRGQNS